MRTVLAVAAAVLLLAAAAFSWRNRTQPELLPRDGARLEIAYFAGGCFWCMEPEFDHLPGVVHVRAGYAGVGDERRETVEIWFDPASTSYALLLDHFWRSVDPVDDGGQFCDRGRNYTSAIYTRDERQARSAAESRLSIERGLGARVSTVVVPYDTFEPAAEDDQNYYRKHPVRYAFYRLNCERDSRLAQVWSER
ncbi:MAG: peptide-methionine (S)-S-oxide reductase [Acidobacteria bacterium]|nr:peptide-methionine (S)-S-oxide reductase [Acidobacteriota bacterium]